MQSGSSFGGPTREETDAVGSAGGQTVMSSISTASWQNRATGVCMRKGSPGTDQGGSHVSARKSNRNSPRGLSVAISTALNTGPSRGRRRLCRARAGAKPRSQRASPCCGHGAPIATYRGPGHLVCRLCPRPEQSDPRMPSFTDAQELRHRLLDLSDTWSGFLFGVNRRQTGADQPPPAIVHAERPGELSAQTNF